MTIYIDIDDCVADFTGYVNSKLGTDLKIGDTMTQENWAEIRKHHQRIFRDLDPIPGMKSLVSDINRSTRGMVAFLTALPYDDHHPWQYAPMDKLHWCMIHFPGIPCFFGPYAHSKKNHCKHGDTLIDDKKSNCDDWYNAGGFAHLFRDPESCRVWLHDVRGMNI